MCDSFEEDREPAGGGRIVQALFECLAVLHATQDDNANYASEWAILDVYKDGKKQFQMLPEKRVYKATQQPQTMVSVHSLPWWDLYVIYEGTNPATGQPIIKAIINPLVGWIWAGVVLVIFGTFIALVPSITPSTAALRVPVVRAVPTEPVLHGGD